MKIVFLDIEKKCILLFTNDGMVNIPLNKMYVLKHHIKNEPVLYVSDAIVTNASEIMNLVASLDLTDAASFEEAGSNVSSPPSYTQMSTEEAYASGEPLFARSTKKNIFVNDMGRKNPQGNPEGHQFKGPLDFQPLSYLDQIGFNESQQVHALISRGDIELVPQSQIDFIKASHVESNPVQNHIQKKQQAYNQNAYYNKHQGILVDNHEGMKSTNAGSIEGNLLDYTGGGFKGDDIIEIDLNKSGFNRSGGGGGMNPNEGGLLPGDV